MNSKQIRKQFLDFFESKNHKIVSSSPIVVKNDPTLMFTNAGMNQFKDYFLGDKIAENVRVADTQKCLRASGKHNDLEDVGLDSYHQTMFEMLGNWSFGDYFKKEAIEWAWELLTDVYKLPKDRLYATVFEGDKEMELDADEEAVSYWETLIPKERILYCDRKDNFWEMGASGPCGPCSEIHIDIRSEEDRKKLDGKELVNKDHPQVIEIWNLVFIQFNRKADGSLEPLPAKHVDTGMGFERLCMAMQGKTSNYDTDVFSPLIQHVEKISGKKYEFSYDKSAKKDIAFRVIVDHIRAVSFAIADGQQPSNTGAGYVIRRILRRAVRYYYSFLDVKEPLLHTLIPLLSEQFAETFPELKAQQDFIKNNVLKEEESFLRTLSQGLKRFEQLTIKDNVLDGQDMFELYDTFGFPKDLTELIAQEKGYKVDNAGFEKAMAKQKRGSQQDAAKEFGDWITINEGTGVEFVGYDELTATGNLMKYRTVKIKNKDQYQVVLDKTAFYAEGGGQIGDTGTLTFGDEDIYVIDTKRENDLIIHFVNKLPQNMTAPAIGKVNATKRQATESNHTATHLLHAALREVLGTHVQQKGSLVANSHLRFDFSHFEKISTEDLEKIEQIVNQKIRENILLGEARSIPIAEAQASGAMMLFGEKYGDTVRMITFDPEYSRELCGGCHVSATGEIGYFKITSESSVAAGVRRIEAISAKAAEEFLNGELGKLDQIRDLFKNPKNIAQSVQGLQEENKELKKEIERLQNAQAGALKTDLMRSAVQLNGYNFIGKKLPLNDPKTIKSLAYQIKEELGNVVIVFGAVVNGNPQISVTISEELIESKKLHAGNLVREIAKEIQGGGGGQAFFATAGGKNISGIENAIAKAKEILG